MFKCVLKYGCGEVCISAFFFDVSLIHIAVNIPPNGMY